jgi:hypothetical protein
VFPKKAAFQEAISQDMLWIVELNARRTAVSAITIFICDLWARVFRCQQLSESFPLSVAISAASRSCNRRRYPRGNLNTRSSAVRIRML